MNHHVRTDGQFAVADSVMTPNLFAAFQQQGHGVCVAELNPVQNTGPKTQALTVW